jgi:NADH-quinone oxidoreductase subunit J
MAVMSRSLLKSTISLGFASATLGIIMYILGATWAAVIEISVCSGLVTVIFISAISLSNMNKDDLRKKYNDKERTAYLPIVLIVTGVILVVVALATDFTLPGATSLLSEDFREVLWNSRQIDVIGQMIAILVGGIAVVVLFRDSKLK